MTAAIILLVGLLLAFYNGYFIINNSKVWHGIGFVIRALLMFVLWPDVLLMSVYLWVVWPLYDVIIRLIMGVSPWHRGTTAWFDRMIPPAVMYTAKGLLTVWCLYLIAKALFF